MRSRFIRLDKVCFLHVAETPGLAFASFHSLCDLTNKFGPKVYDFDYKTVSYNRKTKDVLIEGKVLCSHKTFQDFKNIVNSKKLYVLLEG